MVGLPKIGHVVTVSCRCGNSCSFAIENGSFPERFRECDVCKESMW